jgi:nucleotide-binding universal stress UspA family protein
MYRRILVPIDGSDCANARLREVSRIASQPGHMVLLIHVIEQSGWNEQFQPGTVGEIIQDAQRKEGSDLLDAAKSSLSSFGIPCDRDGLAISEEAILDITALEDAELVLVET